MFCDIKTTIALADEPRVHDLDPATAHFPTFHNARRYSLIWLRGDSIANGHRFLTHRLDPKPKMSQGVSDLQILEKGEPECGSNLIADVPFR